MDFKCHDMNKISSFHHSCHARTKDIDGAMVVEKYHFPTHASMSVYLTAEIHEYETELWHTETCAISHAHTIQTQFETNSVKSRIHYSSPGHDSGRKKSNAFICSRTLVAGRLADTQGDSLYGNVVLVFHYSAHMLIHLYYLPKGNKVRTMVHWR